MALANEQPVIVLFDGEQAHLPFFQNAVHARMFHHVVEAEVDREVQQAMVPAGEGAAIDAQDQAQAQAVVPPQEEQPEGPEYGPPVRHTNVYHEHRATQHVNDFEVRGVSIAGAQGEMDISTPTLVSRLRSWLASALEPRRRVRETDLSDQPSASILPRCARRWRESLVDAIKPPTTSTIVAALQSAVNEDLDFDELIVTPPGFGRLSRVGFKITKHSLDLSSEARLRFGYVEYTPENRRFIDRAIRDLAHAKRKEEEQGWKTMRNTELVTIASRAVTLYWIPRSEDVELAALMHSREYSQLIANSGIERQSTIAH